MGLANREEQHKTMRHDPFLSWPNRSVRGNQQGAPGKRSILPTDDILCCKATSVRKGELRARPLTEMLAVTLNNKVKDNDIAKSAT